MRKTRLTILAVFLGLALVSGCAKPPQEEVDTAQQALERARSAGGADYAPEAMRQAEDALAQLDAELQAQEKKFAMFRSYGNVTRLATEARTAGEKAVTDANEGRERVRGEAETLITEARAAYDEAKMLLVSAPAGKDTQRDIEVLRSDIHGVEASISEAERAYQEGRFLEAKTSAETAKAAATKVISAVQSAKAAKGGV